MTESKQAAIDLLGKNNNYLLLVPTEDGASFEYLWLVKDEEQKEAFKKALQSFLEA